MPGALFGNREVQVGEGKVEEVRHFYRGDLNKLILSKGGNAFEALDEIENLPFFDLRTMKRGEIVSLTSEGMLGYCVFECTHPIVKDTDHMIGNLIFDDQSAYRFGINTVIHDVTVVGSALSPYGGGMVNTVKMISTFYAEILAPTRSVAFLKGLGGIDLPNICVNIGPLETTMPMEPSDDYLEVLNNPLVMKVETVEVSDWPGKSIGVEREQVEKVLYNPARVVGGGLFGRYWVNPIDGTLFKSLMPLKKHNTVWSTAELYLESHLKEPNPFNLNRAAAFVYWGLMYGLRPPEEILTKFEEAGFPFKVG